MKKLLSTIMAVVMLLSLMPMAVAEGGVTAEDAVAQIGGQFYTTLADAVAAVPEDGTETTITLLKDTSENIKPDGKNIVLDLGDKTLTGTITFYAGDLTVQNGTVKGTIYAYTATEDKAYNHLTIASDAVIDGFYAVILYQKAVGANNFGSTIDVSGTLKGNLWVMGNITTDLVTAKNPCVVKVHDGAVIESGADNVGIALNGAAKMTVDKANITSGTGIEVRAGELTVNGATVVGTGVPANVTPNGSGTTTTGAGIAVAQHTTKLPINVTINSGDISGYSALYQSNPQNNASEGKVSVAVNGGTFKAINGGTCGVCSVNDCVAINAGAFTDLASAVKYATDGAKITLAEDAKGDIVIPADKTITLDLGGHKLTNVSGNTITNEGTLTITGTGTVDNVTNGKAALYNKGAATLNGGTFERSTEAGVDSKNNGGNSFYTILNHGEMTVNKGVVVNNNGHFSSLFENGYFSYNNQDGVTNPSLIINGGTFDGGLNTIKNDDNATLVINNGTFKNYTQACVQNHHVAEINGGEYIGNKAAAVLMCGACNTVDETHDRHVMSITDGNFKGALTVTVGQLTIKGGTFTVDPSKFVTGTNLVVVPNVGKTEYTVQPKTSQEGNATTTTEVSEDGKTVTETVTETKTDGNTVTKTETNVDTGAATVTKTETKVEGNVTTKTETVTEKNAAGETTKVTESKIVENNENGKTETKTTVDGKTVKTDVTVNQAPATASDVRLNAKALEGKAAGTETSSVTVDRASLSELKKDAVKDVIIETDQATLKLDKTAVKTMEGNVPTNGKMTLNVTVTEEKNATTTDIEKVKVEVTAKNEAGQNVFPENTANTNGLINITIPYTGNATQLDLWYIAANASATYMGRFPVVNGFVSFDVKHFSQYDLIPVASSGSSVIKTGAGSSAASTTQTVTTDLTPGSITKVTVDGKVVDAKYYTVSGSNVTFTAEFLKTLKNGSHTVTVENATKIAKGVFTVNNPTTAVQAPTTADAGIALYAGMAIASVMGTGVVFTSRKRKNH